MTPASLKRSRPSTKPGAVQRVYRLPIGCATGRGAASFASAYRETMDQLRAKGACVKTLIHASSAGSTHAGLVLGRELLEDHTRIIAVVVASDVYEDVPAAYVRLASQAAHLLGGAVSIGREHLELTSDYLGEGYGQPAPGVAEGIDLMARLEGIVVDPVYSAKAVAALIDLSRRTAIDGPVLFWHTGGYHSLFDPSYTARLWAELPRRRNLRL